MKTFLEIGLAIGAIVAIAYFCFSEPRVKKEMCINANVMDEENFGKQVPCE